MNPISEDVESAPKAGLVYELRRPQASQSFRAAYERIVELAIYEFKAEAVHKPETIFAYNRGQSAMRTAQSSSRYAFTLDEDRVPVG
ncbi:MAG: hypothetical protein QW057_02845 [Candidatus Bathyarchaeia archaeon]